MKKELEEEEEEKEEEEKGRSDLSRFYDEIFSVEVSYPFTIPRITTDVLQWLVQCQSKPS